MNNYRYQKFITNGRFIWSIYIMSVYLFQHLKLYNMKKIVQLKGTSVVSVTSTNDFTTGSYFVEFSNGTVLRVFADLVQRSRKVKKADTLTKFIYSFGVRHIYIDRRKNEFRTKVMGIKNITDEAIKTINALPGVTATKKQVSEIGIGRTTTALIIRTKERPSTIAISTVL